MNTSNSGQSLLISALLSCSLRGFRTPAGGSLAGRSVALLLFRIRRRRLANPATFVISLLARLQPLPIARPVALQHRLELVPVDRPEPVMLAPAFATQLGIRDCQAEELRLRGCDINELLTQLVVGETFDLPAHRLRGVLGLRIVRAKHHDGRPPPAIECVLRHGALLRRTPRKRQHDLEALPLMETFFLADTDHRARIGTVRATAE